MRKLSKDLKKNFPREREAIRSNRKTERPWVLQYKWFSEECFRKHSWLRNYNPNWIDHCDKYVDTDHALQMLNKELRSYKWMTQQWRDRASRLYNKKTGEILPLEVQDDKVKIQYD